MAFWSWSRTAATNASADSTINWAEGQAPSSINDSARAMMAAQAKWRDDISGAIATGGTSTAYTVTSLSVFDTLAHMDGQMIAFTPHTTNGATVTLNVDGLGSKPLRTAPTVELQSNVLIQGTPYVATYSNSDAVWYLHNLASNTYGVPLGAGMDYWLPTAPSSAFVFPTGQAISRTTYATLFAAMGTTYGVGDGSTTFNLPDKTGRVSAMKEATGTRLTTAAGGVDGGTLGAVGGGQSQTLTLAQLPTGITSSGTLPVSGNVVTSDSQPALFSAGAGGASVWRAWSTGSSLSTTTTSAVGTSTSFNTSGNAHPIVQPTIVCNYIIRII